MSFLDWNDATITNHTTIDKDHKKMLDDTNKLYSYVTSNKNEKANKLFLKIVNDLKIHFDTEERLIDESKMPLFISHKLEHERFYNKVRNLQKSVASGKEVLNVAHLKIVKIWFYNHIDFKDKPLAEYLIEHNTK
jgi:hemerythrin